MFNDNHATISVKVLLLNLLEILEVVIDRQAITVGNNEHIPCL